MNIALRRNPGNQGRVVQANATFAHTRPPGSVEHIYQGAQEQVYSRLLLYEALVGYKGNHEARTSSSDYVCEARRDFLDAFAYLCDVEKGGGTVTAAGLQKLSENKILWLAANEGIRTEVKQYAEELLRKLKELSMSNETATRNAIFARAVDMCAPRIAFYKSQVQEYARNCRMQLRSEEMSVVDKALRRRLGNLHEPGRTTTVGHLIDCCHSMRGPEVNEIAGRSKKEGDDFSRLAHYIGRLGATRSKVDCVVRAFGMVPSLRQISTIRTVNPPGPRDISFSFAAQSPYEIVRRICQEAHVNNVLDVSKALLAFVQLDVPPSNELRDRVASWRTFGTWVHAELQVADMFSRRNFDFVDGDTYIGCSKPACYFCYNWLSYHRRQYVVPATHQRVLPLCRGPDNDLNDNGAFHLKDMYEKLSGQLGKDIIAFLLEEGESGQRRYQPMSTNGTSRAPTVA